MAPTELYALNHQPAYCGGCVGGNQFTGQIQLALEGALELAAEQGAKPSAPAPAHES